MLQRSRTAAALRSRIISGGALLPNEAGEAVFMAALL
jgi:hypothetical protein